MISQSTIEEVKEKANLIEIIGETVALKRQGSSYIGLCPFHAEKTPSFHVREYPKGYHCFGCGINGNALSFIMETRGLSFPEAVEELAARYGVEIKHEGATGDVQRTNPEIFYKINQVAFQYFKKALKGAGSEVTSYLNSRINAEGIEEFGVGFAPLSWNGLRDILREKKISDEVLINSGLVRRSPKGDLYDIFRGRLMFPVWIDKKRIAGFGGRAIPALTKDENVDSIPKYLNSPETPIYQKNKILYGLPQALLAIRQTHQIYLVEGYLDVIGLWQAGIQNVAASCGTALTENHVKRLAHFAKRVLVLFDGDEAGRAAAAKSFQIFLNSGIDATAIFLPDGEDPDTIAAKYGNRTEDFLKSCEKVLLIDCFINSLVQKYGCKNVRELGAAAKGKIGEELARSIARVQNSIEQSELIERAALRLGIAAEHITKLAQDSSSPRKPNIEIPSTTQDSPVPTAMNAEGFHNTPIPDLPRIDRELLHVVMTHREEATFMILHDADICLSLAPATRYFVEALDGIVHAADSSDDKKKEQVRALLRELGDSWVTHWKKSHEMLAEPGVHLMQSFKQCVVAIKKSKINQAVREIDRQIAECADDHVRLGLIQEKLSLSRKLSQL